MKLCEFWPLKSPFVLPPKFPPKTLISTYRLVAHTEDGADQEGGLPLQGADVGRALGLVDPGGGGGPQEGHLTAEVKPSHTRQAGARPALLGVN